MADESVKVREEGRGTSVADYWPLISLVVVAGLVALAIGAGYDAFAMRPLMHAYMGAFLAIFALLKIFDPPGFADGFEMYDLLAKRSKAYGYIYPFIELGLALAYLSFFVPVFTYLATIVVFTFGAIGVVKAVREGIDIDCPCMGTTLRVPLSTVTLVEDAAMVLMALILLFRG